MGLTVAPAVVYLPITPVFAPGPVLATNKFDPETATLDAPPNPEMNGADVIGAASVANPGRAGTSKAPGILTVTAKPTSCGKTTMARSRSGR